MAIGGKLEKVLILAFETAEAAEKGNEKDAKDSFEALINPETYVLEYKVKTSDNQVPGTSGSQIKYVYTLPEELNLEFLFDNTGIVDGKPKTEGVFEDVNHLRLLLIEYKGNSHEPYYIKLVWGNLIFKGRAIEFDITYKLFNPDGQPIRAVVRVKFKGSIEEKKRVSKENSTSPDLTHIRNVKAGDTLPLLCYKIYGDPKYYIQIAAINELDNFRCLQAGTKLIFPPITKAVGS